MERIIEIYVKGVGNIDVQTKTMNDFGIEIDYQVDDLINLGQKKSNFSKSIKILGTPNNNSVMDHIYDLAHYSESVDKTKRVPCVLMLNTNVIMDGFFKIKDIETVYVAGKYQVVYTINIFDEVNDLFKSLGDKKLTDLDFSRTWGFDGSSYSTGDHVFDYSTVKTSFSRIVDYTNIYEYPIINYNYDGENDGENFIHENGVLDMSQMYPSIYIKSIVDRIFHESGYKYSSGLFSGQIDDANFLNLVTIYNGGTMNTNANYYKGGISGNQGVSAVVTGSSMVQIDIDDEIYHLDYYEEVPNGSIIIKSTGNYKIKYDYDMSLRIISGDTKLVVMNNDTVIQEFELYDSPYSNEFEIDTKLTAGDVLTFNIDFNLPEDTPVILHFVTFTEFNVSLKLIYPKLEVDKLNTVISVSDYLPDMTQKDFLKDLIKIYNLYIYTSTDDIDTLIIDPRDTFYSQGELLDWTDKLDVSKIKIEPSTKVLNNTYNFEMSKNDTIKTNEYEEENGYTFGSLEIDTENEDVSSKSELKIGFGGYGSDIINTFYIVSDIFYIPNLVKDSNDNVGTQKRLVKPMIGYIKNHTIQNYLLELIDDGELNGVIINQAKSVNHYETFNTNVYDINYYTNSNDLSYALNSYNTYWKKTLTNLFNVNQRFVTMYFQLNIVDILKINLNNVIRVDNIDYYVYRIVNDISDDGLTKVEMIKALDYNYTLILPDLNVIQGYFNVGEIPSGVGRPVVTSALIDTGYEKTYNGTSDFAITPTSYENYNWVAIPIITSTSKKNFWYVDEWNQGEIGGEIGLTDNLIPEPEIFKYNGRDYYVYMFNYQTVTSPTLTDFIYFKNSK